MVRHLDTQQLYGADVVEENWEFFFVLWLVSTYSRLAMVILRSPRLPRHRYKMVVLLVNTTEESEPSEDTDDCEEVNVTSSAFLWRDR